VGESSQLRFQLKPVCLSSSSLRYREAGVSELDACSAVANRWLSWVGESVVVEWLLVLSALAKWLRVRQGRTVRRRHL